MGRHCRASTARPCVSGSSTSSAIRWPSGSTASSWSRTSGASARAKGAGGTTYSTTTRPMRGSDRAHEPHEELERHSDLHDSHPPPRCHAADRARYPDSEGGIQHAPLVAGRLNQGAFHTLSSSDLGRAIQTAEIVASKCQKQVQLVAGLRERHMGIFQGLTLAEMRERSLRNALNLNGDGACSLGSATLA